MTPPVDNLLQNYLAAWESSVIYTACRFSRKERQTHILYFIFICCFCALYIQRNFVCFYFTFKQQASSKRKMVGSFVEHPHQCVWSTCPQQEIV